MLEAHFLGRFDVRIDGSPIEISSRKAQSLLAYLMLNLEVQHRREKVAGILWPETDEATARSKLRYSLWQLRKAVGGQYILADKISLTINPEADFWFDGAVLEEAPGERLTTEGLQQVVSIYEGELLPGFYEDWVSLERERLQAIFERKIGMLLERLVIEERWREVLEWGEKWISLGQTPESAFQALMVAHSQLGDTSSAVRIYQRCVTTLDEQLGVEPSRETKEIYQLLFEGGKPDAAYLGEPEQGHTKVYSGNVTIPAYEEMIEELPEIKRSTFVARERELSHLTEKLELVLDGHGQVVFVAGDAGQGKTALLHEFSRRAQVDHDHLVVTIGSCEAQTGIGDPNLPFRDILALLAGDIESRWSTGAITRENARRLWKLIPVTAKALVEKGPDLIGSFVPADVVWARANNYPFESGEWLNQLQVQVDLRKGRPIPVHVDHGNIQKDLFDQFTRVMQSIAEEHPLILVLDDLQWADLGSIGLLFHLSRRIEGHQIMILGAFRRDDISQSWDGKQHPLGAVLMELKRIFGEIEINLDDTSEEEGRRFIDAFLDSEPNRLEENFRKALNLHTGGHPLFTIELLRQMEVQRDIRKDKHGRWIESTALGWENLPAKVEAVIERRINRLPSDLRDVLNVASIEGVEFTAEVIAAVTGIERLEIIRMLSGELDKRHLLVEVSGIQYVDQQRLSRYQFRHNLFHKYVYENMDVVEQVNLHEEIGFTLERIYGGQTGQIAVNLARHFKAAGVVEKAIDYLLQAGDVAKRLSANEEAITYLTRGLELLDEIPEGRLRDEKELALQASLGAPLVATKGYSAPEVEQTFERARELCERTGDIGQLAPVLWGLCAFYQVRGKHARAYEMAEQILSLAEEGEDANLHLLAHWMLGLTLTHLGEFTKAREHLNSAIDLDSGDDYAPLTYLYGQNPGVTCLNYLALNLWTLGYPDQAREKCAQAISLSEEISHPYSQSFAQGMAALYHALRKDTDAALQHSERAIKLSKEAGFPFLLALGLIIRGWARSFSGKTGMAVKLMRNGIEAMQAIGAELGRPFFLSLLAEGYGNAGQSDEGLKILGTAMRAANKNKEHWCDCDLHRLMGELLEMQGGTESEITSSYHQAVEIARKQNAKSFELRGLIEISRYGERHDQPGKGREELAGVYDWFREGYEGNLLREAGELLK
jgi:predicted ATPase/DNA-binding SARP family transcriptional activator